MNGNQLNDTGNQNHSHRLTVVIVRHGERLDYAHRAAGKNWCEVNPDRPWDPPLTENGLAMATQVGCALQQDILPSLGLGPISAVYTSPFLRCRSTAAGIIQGVSSGKSDNEASKSNRELKVRVEMGLSEIINEDWYRSWSLKGTDGTWGYKTKEIPRIDPERDGMDLRALGPVEELLDWRKSNSDDHRALDELMDYGYKSQTSLGGRYSFAGDPPKLESACMRRDRISSTINLLCDMDRKQSNGTTENTDKEKHETIVLVSHGGIVSEFYANLTGNDSKNHGVAKYCSFSIYQNDIGNCKTAMGNGEANKNWTPLVVNRILWDDVQKLDSNEAR